jgi:hypothetical protein
VRQRVGLAHQDMMDAAQRFRQIPFTAGVHLVVQCVNTQIIINDGDVGIS